jgi:glycosyltransferase involved in cell wall biosynthesis
MRLALVHYTAPPIIGGVERVIAEHQRLFASHGHHVEIFTACEERLAHFDVVMIHNVVTMPFDLGFTSDLRQMMEQHPEVRWINWVHDVARLNPHYAHLPWDDSSHRQLSEPPTNCVHVAVSEHRRQEYASATGLSVEKIAVVPNGVDCARVLGLTPLMEIAAIRYRLWQRQLVLVHPTRLVRRKNLELGLEVTAALRRAGCDVAYLITGAADPHNAASANYRAELNAQACRLGLEESVAFLGDEQSLDEEDVRSLYALGDALFFPSLAEGFGLPLLEAPLHGLPLFCSDIPVHREVAPVNTVWFDLPGNAEAIAATILTDGPTRMRAQRREVFARHDWSQLWDRHLRVQCEGGREPG